MYILVKVLAHKGDIQEGSQLCDLAFAAPQVVSKHIHAALSSCVGCMCVSEPT